MSKTKISEAHVDAEEVCVVCFKNVELYSIGVCDHPVCFECSTRMRVVCNQKECPICRGEMPEVVFTKEIKPFKDLEPSAGLTEKTHGIQFMSRSIQSAYYKLLELVCNVCGQRFRQFHILKEHMRKEHELHYCDLCVKNLMIFAFERRCYTRSELALHRRKGDPDNTSHRGHPLCEFCDERYMDNDHLFRHLRRDHLYCHFCDADGKHQYYRSYQELRQHFMDDHFLCEQGNCLNDMLTSVFRTEIDLKAHIATAHSKQMGRAASKQARTLELEFNFKSRRPKPEAHRERDREQQDTNRNGRRPTSSAASFDYNSPIEEEAAPSTRRPLTAADFPTLGGNPEAAPSHTSVTFTSKMSRPKFNNEEFPSLGGSSATAAATTPTVPTSSLGAVPRNPRNITITKTSTAEFRRPQGLPGGYYNYNNDGYILNKRNFPTLQAESLSGNSTVKLTVKPRPLAPPANVSIHVNHDGPGVSSSTSIQVRPKTMSEAFPALGGGFVPETKQWVAPKPKKQQEPKVKNVAKAPVLPTSSISDFPSLGKKTEKKSASVSVPIRDVNNTNKSQQKQENNNNDLSTSGKKNQNQNGNSNPKKKDGAWNNSNGNKGNKSNKERNQEQETLTNNNKNKKKNKAEVAASSSSQAGASSSRAPETTASATPSAAPAGSNGASDAENFLIKKTSTLKIGNLAQNPKLNPPPGFAVKPPPGFRLSTNDLTFTSSSGQSYSILPHKIGPDRQNYKYYQPPNFKSRNTELINVFTTLTQKHDDSMNEFKAYSALFRAGKYPAKQYYEHCREFLGEQFNCIFLELLVLLPDIEKQQELYSEYISDGNCELLTQCTSCGQLVHQNEYAHHLKAHRMATQFPSLGTSNAATAAAAAMESWKKL